MADLLLKFSEQDVRGAVLPLLIVEDNTADDLRRWILTRGLCAPKSESKASLVRR